MKGYVLAAIIAALLVLSVCHGERESREWGRRLRDATHARDTILARNAEREVGYMAANDSLRKLLARKPSVVVRHDTALVPVAQWLYITDTLVPKCQQCAERSDALIEQARAERDASNALIDLYQRRTRELEKRIALGPRFESAVAVDRSLIVGDIRVSVRGDVRLFGRVHGYARAEHTFGYPPRSDLRIGVEARP